jgi:hypothetical protein
MLVGVERFHREGSLKGASIFQVVRVDKPVRVVSCKYPSISFFLLLFLLIKSRSHHHT